MIASTLPAECGVLIPPSLVNQALGLIYQPLQNSAVDSHFSSHRANIRNGVPEKWTSRGSNRDTRTYGGYLGDDTARESFCETFKNIK